MNLHDPQQELSEFIKSAAEKVKRYYWWRLSGDAPNSLCKFLALDEHDLKIILPLCKIYNGDSDSFSKNNFDLLMLRCQPHLDWAEYRLNRRPECFIKIGRSGEGGKCKRPKNYYESNGTLLLYPVADKHIPSIRSKLQCSVLTKLLTAAAGGGNQ
jgi:hypothetical protein